MAVVAKVRVLFIPVSNLLVTKVGHMHAGERLDQQPVPHYGTSNSEIKSKIAAYKCPAAILQIMLALPILQLLFPGTFDLSLEPLLYL